MQTALLLLVLVFAPFIWFIVKMLRYTQKTIGEDSPLYSTQSYQWSAYDYFAQFVKLLLAFLFFLLGMLVYITANAAVQQHMPILFFFSVFFAASTAYVAFIFYFDWHYWINTRNVRITLDPVQPSITIATPSQISYLTPSNTVRIEHHLRKTTNSKDPLGGYGFFLFYRADQSVIPLNNIFLIHVEFLERFFKNVPQTIVWHTYPWMEGSWKNLDTRTLPPKTDVRE